MRDRPTADQLRRSAEKRKETAARVPVEQGDVGKRFKEYVLAFWDQGASNINITYRLPCGSMFKIVCLETAVEKAERAGKKARSKP